MSYKQTIQKLALLCGAVALVFMLSVGCADTSTKTSSSNLLLENATENSDPTDGNEASSPEVPAADYSMLDALDNDTPIAQVGEITLFRSTLTNKMKSVKSALDANLNIYKQLSNSQNDLADPLLTQIEAQKREAAKSERQVMRELVLSEAAFQKSISLNTQASYEDAYAFVKRNWETVKEIAQQPNASDTAKEAYRFMQKYMTKKDLDEAGYLKEAARSMQKENTLIKLKKEFFPEHTSFYYSAEQETVFYNHLAEWTKDIRITYF